MDVVDVFRHRGEFFKVLQETKRSQPAVMTIAPGSDPGSEEQHEADQIIYVVEATVRIGEKEHRAGAGGLVTIAAGTPHHVSNPGQTPLFFVTVYARPSTEPRPLAVLARWACPGWHAGPSPTPCLTPT